MQASSRDVSVGGPPGMIKRLDTDRRSPRGERLTATTGRPITSDCISAYTLTSYSGQWVVVD